MSQVSRFDEADNVVMGTVEIEKTVKVNADTNNRLTMWSDGKHEWGSGAAAPDVVLERARAGVLQITTGSMANRVTNLTAGTLTLSEAIHGNGFVTVNKADGTAITLPAASGSGVRFRIFIGTTITSVGTTIKVANASDTMVGMEIVAQDGGSTALIFEIGGTDDTITLNGTTTGGIKGDMIEIIDIATNLWYVNMLVSGTGTEAISTSATV